MSLSLEESKKIQIDHYRKSRHLPDEPAHKANDKVSYETLWAFLPDKKCKILDLGCGEARGYEYLSEHDYYGLECVEEALEIAKKKVESPDNLKLGMVEEIPFEDEFFDVVWARHVLEHSSDMEKTLNEILRVLKSDGLLIYALPQGKHNEPAHLYQTDRTGWFKLLSSKFGMLKDGEHPFNLREYYGVCKKTPPRDKWTKFHEKALPYEQAISQEPFRTLIQVIEDFVKQHKIDILFETGFGTGYAMVRLAEIFPDIDIFGTDNSPRCRQKFESLAKDRGLKFSGKRIFATLVKTSPDIFNPNLYEKNGVPLVTGKCPLIYHQGLLEHFSDEKIQELLELQTKNSYAVIFSVPSKFYGKQDFGDERLLTLKEWKEILEPFEILQIRYYNNNKHILGILKGGFYGESEGA